MCFTQEIYNRIVAAIFRGWLRLTIFRGSRSTRELRISKRPRGRKGKRRLSGNADVSYLLDESAPSNFKLEAGEGYSEFLERITFDRSQLKSYDSK